MRYVMTTVCAVLVCGVTAAGQTPKGREQADKNPAPTIVTVTGCVAGGIEGGSLMLTHASRADPTAKPKSTKPKDAMGKEAMAKALTYTLVGGTGLNAHLGHKVEISGTIAKRVSAAEAKPGMPGMMHEAVTVKTVKMLSAICP